LHFDGQPYAWQTLGAGRTVLILPQARELEVLLYGDSPFAFELHSIAVERCLECTTESISSRTFPGWQVTHYVSGPVLLPYTRDLQAMWVAPDGAVELRGNGSAAGVLLARQLDPKVTYRLILHGGRRNAAPALRLKVDDQPFIWRTVDRGDGDLNIV